MRQTDSIFIWLNTVMYFCAFLRYAKIISAKRYSIFENSGFCVDYINDWQNFACKKRAAKSKRRLSHLSVTIFKLSMWCANSIERKTKSDHLYTLTGSEAYLKGHRSTLSTFYKELFIVSRNFCLHISRQLITKFISTSKSVGWTVRWNGKSLATIAQSN